MFKRHQTWFARCLATLPLVFLVIGFSALAAEEAPLLSAREVLDLSRTDAERGRPVRLRAMVHAHDQTNGCLYVQDLTGGIRVRVRMEGPFAVRALVDIEGRTSHAYSPEVIADKLTLLPGTGARTAPGPTSTSGGAASVAGVPPGA